MAHAEEQSYYEMIEALEKFITAVEEQCDEMENAATDCVDNTEDDVTAVNSSDSLKASVTNIRDAVSRVSAIKAALQDEIDEIVETGKKSSNAD